MSRTIPHYLTPAPFKLADVNAIQALHGGVATPDQQKRVLEWLIVSACNTHDLSFDPGSERGTAFAEGRRFVGLQIIKMLKLDRTKLKEQGNG